MSEFIYFNYGPNRNRLIIKWSNFVLTISLQHFFLPFMSAVIVTNHLQAHQFSSNLDKKKGILFNWSLVLAVFVCFLLQTFRMIPSSKFHEKRVKKYYIIELIPHGDFCVAKREVNILVVWWSIFFCKIFSICGQIWNFLHSSSFIAVKKSMTK